VAVAVGCGAGELCISRLVACKLQPPAMFLTPASLLSAAELFAKQLAACQHVAPDRCPGQDSG
jgi:hypothetical protein